jgi:uncharacterized protein YecE (DUF72 family)
VSTRAGVRYSVSVEDGGGARILIGTSGYSYDDWVGPFYPAGTAKRDFLALYAREFPAVELNFSYYQQPGARMLEGMLAATPASFLFALKAHRSMTHEIGDTWEKDIAAFRQGIRPLAESGRLAAVLLQFPYSFAYSPDSRRRLAELCARLEGLPLAVEFRKSEWMRPSVEQGLRERGVALVNVDEPELPGLPPAAARVTAELAYVRFHGRNAAAWWTGDNASRYDYLYSSEELAQWTQRVKEIFARTRLLLVFFNNHFRGQAVENARQFRQILAQDRLHAAGGPQDHDAQMRDTQMHDP